MDKPGRLLLTQVDNVSEEVLGFALEKLMELGANNVQLIPTLTKKKRPGNVILIDTNPDKEDAIRKFLVTELKVSGYHRAETRHVFERISFIKKTLRITHDGKVEVLHCEAKAIGDPEKPLSIDLEHDFLVSLQSSLSEKLGLSIPLTELRSMVEAKLRSSREEITLEL